MYAVAFFAIWQFGSWAMLGWSAAALLPILIHLWSKRRYQETTWAAMEYLLAAMRKNARRIQVEQWLLLILRTLILALFAVAIADPTSSILSAWMTAGGGQTHYVLVLDGSYSMDYRAGGPSRFEAAKDFARQQVQAGKQGDGFTLLLMGQPPRVVIGEPAFDPGDVREELDNLALTHGGASLPAVLAEIETILRQAEKQHPRLVQKKVCFFTDLQQTTWGEIESDDCRGRLARLADIARLSLLDVGHAETATNLAVTRLEAVQSLATVATPTTFLAELQNFGKEDRPRQTVTFLVDGRRVAEQVADLTAGGRSSVSFTHRLETAGEHLVEVRLTSDPLLIDNQRWLSLPVRESIRVLAVYGKPGETGPLSLALETGRGTRQRVRVDQAPESSVAEADLSRYDCVFLCNVGRFSRDEAKLLADYVQRGGGLVVFLGDQVQAENYNQELGGEASGRRSLPAKLLQTVSEGQYALDPLEYRHSLVAPFRGYEKSGLLTTPIWRYIQLKPLDEAKIALAFAAGGPALIEERMGRGRSILFASAASTESVQSPGGSPWTAISSWPSFYPLVQEMLALAVSGRAEGRNLLIGEDFVGVIPNATAETPVNILAPDGHLETAPLTLDRDAARWTYNGLLTSGAYEVRIGAPVSSVQRYAVNVNTLESDLTHIPLELLPSQISLELEGGEDGGPTALADPTQSHFRELLLAVVALMVLETLLAWRFGRGAA